MKNIYKIRISFFLAISLFVLWPVFKAEAAWDRNYCDIINQSSDAFGEAIQLYNEKGLRRGCRKAIRFKAAGSTPLPGGGITIYQIPPRDGLFGGRRSEGVEIRSCQSGETACPDGLDNTNVILDASNYDNGDGTGDCPFKVREGANIVLQDLHIIVSDPNTAFCRLNGTPLTWPSPIASPVDATIDTFVILKNVVMERACDHQTSGFEEPCSVNGICGNGVVEPGEECDDGNTTSGDGCSSSCHVEQPQPVCGNGVVEPGEECDDGNTTSGDGCNGSCHVEQPQPICGNGIVEPGEECDDRNQDDFDGCTNDCLADQDHDGVSNSQDKCPDTPLETKVDEEGCPLKDTSPDTSNSKGTGQGFGCSINARSPESASDIGILIIIGLPLLLIKWKRS